MMMEFALLSWTFLLVAIVMQRLFTRRDIARLDKKLDLIMRKLGIEENDDQSR